MGQNQNLYNISHCLGKQYFKFNGSYDNMMYDDTKKCYSDKHLIQLTQAK